MIVLDVRSRAHAAGGDAAKAVPNEERRIGRNGNIVVDRVGRALTQVEPFSFVGKYGANLHAIASLLNIDLNLLCRGLGFLTRMGLHPNRRGYLHFAAGFSMHSHFAEFVLDAKGLPGSKRERFLEIA